LDQVNRRYGRITLHHALTGLSDRCPPSQAKSSVVQADVSTESPGDGDVAPGVAETKPAPTVPVASANESPTAAAGAQKAAPATPQVKGKPSTQETVGTSTQGVTPVQKAKKTFTIKQLREMVGDVDKKTFANWRRDSGVGTGKPGDYLKTYKMSEATAACPTVPACPPRFDWQRDLPHQ